MLEMRDLWIERAKLVCDVDPLLLPRKIFEPKFSLPKLDDYSKEAPNWYWKLLAQDYLIKGQS